jgi:hypothetical protein
MQKKTLDRFNCNICMLSIFVMKLRKKWYICYDFEQINSKEEYKWITRLMAMHTSLTIFDVPDFRKF